jgi:hypothetical protein
MHAIRNVTSFFKAIWRIAGAGARTTTRQNYGSRRLLFQYPELASQGTLDGEVDNGSGQCFRTQPRGDLSRAN